MSATLRYDIGLAVYEFSVRALPGMMVLWDALGARPASRWAGVHRPTKRCMTFAVKLPSQVGRAWQLLRVMRAIRRRCSEDFLAAPAAYSGWADVDGFRPDVAGAAIYSARKLLRKLEASLGMPPHAATADGPPPGEEHFWGAIDDRPDELAHWAALSDFLQEGRGYARHLRGQVVAGWLGPRAVPVKYGVPVLARVSGVYNLS